ncbi:sensor histidine kinase [Lysobacter korlensis]|uniref:histidine kinase n=2 Tax=Lysobacter korlensis TaxID=553636 RepID=A0ABV6RIC0_9GAMM
MLLGIAVDIETAQSDEQQTRKSQGLGEASAARSAASIHGSLRQSHEFSLIQVSAEFRALRSTVLRLWLPGVDDMSESTVREVVRFNESIDQALAESIVAYGDASTHARQLFLAVLGHDLRSPLANMALTGEMLAREGLSAQQLAQLAKTVQRSSRVMKGMVDDLLGYTRTQLGKGLSITQGRCDLAEALDAAIADAAATYPQTCYELEVTGGPAGHYDATRLHQLFVNLLVNAAQHGARSRPVTVKATATPGCNRIRITNQGTAIPEAALKAIFKPLVQLADDDTSDTRPKTSLGLGLFIAREIAEGHGGRVSVESDEVRGTTFTVELPRDE